MNQQFYFKASHSTGTTHLRCTSRRPDYAFAVVGPKLGSVTCHRTRELANKEKARQAEWCSDREVVPVVEIDKAEYAKLKKASKRTVRAVFMGKKYTMSVNADCAIPVAAVGYDYEAYTTHHTPLPGTPAAEKWPNGWDNEHRARRGVEWFWSHEDLKAYVEGSGRYSHRGARVVGQDHLVHIEQLAVEEI